MRQRKLGARPYGSAGATTPGLFRRLVLSSLFVTFGAAGASAASAATAKTVMLSDASNGHVITVSAGTIIDVTLTGSNWTFQTTGLNKIATLSGTTTIKENRPIITGRVPSVCPSGCTYEEAHYVARHPGQMRLLASRTSCSGGAPCGTVNRQWTVVVRIH